MRQYLDEFEYLKRNNLFNVETINIFSDASYRKNKAGAFGAIAIYQNVPITEDIRWNQCKDESINSLELKGIRTAIAMAFYATASLQRKLGKPVMINYINIFSDSKYSVDMIKAYLFTDIAWEWDSYLGVYVKRMLKTPVPNQDLIIEIANMILKFQATFPNIVLDLWWCPAHEKLNNNLATKVAGKRFKKNNCKRAKNITVDDDFIRYVCDANNAIDSKVVKKSNEFRMNKDPIKEAVKFDFSPGGTEWKK
jgi:ribonuclease HI